MVKFGPQWVINLLRAHPAKFVRNFFQVQPVCVIATGAVVGTVVALANHHGHLCVQQGVLGVIHGAVGTVIICDHLNGRHLQVFLGNLAVHVGALFHKEPGIICVKIINRNKIITLVEI